MTMEGSEGVAEDVQANAGHTLTQDQVRKVVQREKAEAAEKARREAMAEYEKQLEALRNQPSMGGMSPQFDKEEMYSQFKSKLMKEVQEEQDKQYQNQRQQEMNRIAGEYLGKMSKGKELYEDFDSVTANFEPEAFPQVVFLTSKMDNAPDIIYELSKNPSKLVTINNLAMTSPRMAEYELQKLADSIKNNQSALANNQTASPPLSRIQPSATASVDNSGPKSVRDFRKMRWLRS